MCLYGAQWLRLQLEIILCYYLASTIFAWTSLAATLQRRITLITWRETEYFSCLLSTPLPSSFLLPPSSSFSSSQPCFLSVTTCNYCVIMEPRLEATLCISRSNGHVSAKSSFLLVILKILPAKRASTNKGGSREPPTVRLLAAGFWLPVCLSAKRKFGPSSSSIEALKSRSVTFQLGKSKRQLQQ